MLVRICTEEIKQKSFKSSYKKDNALGTKRQIWESMSSDFNSWFTENYIQKILIQAYIERPYLNFVYTCITLHKRVTITKANEVIASLEKKKGF